MTHGFVPELSDWSPYHGAQYAVLLSVAKLVALGGRREDAYLTLQEYFERLNSKESWGKPVAALLGAYKAQKELEIGAIGGKDSYEWYIYGSYSSSYPCILCGWYSSCR